MSSSYWVLFSDLLTSILEDLHDHAIETWKRKLVRSGRLGVGREESVHCKPWRHSRDSGHCVTLRISVMLLLNVSMWRKWIIMLLKREEFLAWWLNNALLAIIQVGQTEWTRNVQKAVDLAYQATTKIAAGNADKQRSIIWYGVEGSSNWKQLWRCSCFGPQLSIWGDALVWFRLSTDSSASVQLATYVIGFLNVEIPRFFQLISVSQSQIERGRWWWEGRENEKRSCWRANCIGSKSSKSSAKAVTLHILVPKAWQTHVVSNILSWRLSSTGS
jgi:hypothetical protein